MSSGIYPKYTAGPGADEKTRIEAAEGNIKDLYNLLSGTSGLMPTTADDAEITSLMAGSGVATVGDVRRGLDGAAVAAALDARGISRAEVRRMLEEVLVEMSLLVRPISRNDVQRMADEAVQTAASVPGISRGEVQKMIDDAMVSVIMD